MVVVEQIIYTHASGVTQDFRTNNPAIDWLFPGKEVAHKNNMFGKTIDPNRGFRRVTCSSKLTASELKSFHDYLKPSSAPVYDAYTAVGGAVAVDASVAETDETTEANEATANDMTLLPAAAAVGDYYAIGAASPFSEIKLTVGTAGGNTWVITWEYSTGSDSWVALSDVVDDTDDFMTAGTNTVTWTMPPDWATDEVGSISDLFWIRGRLSSLTNYTTQPKGTQAWIRGLYPYMTIKLDGSVSFAMPCVIMSPFKAVPFGGGNKWLVTAIFEERTL